MAFLCETMCGSDKCLNCLSYEIKLWFDKHIKLGRVVVSLNLLEYHLVIPNPSKKVIIYANG